MFEDVLCLIPARGGSKGVPKKNLQPLQGLPLVIHSIKQAIEDGIPRENVVVSSDSEDILRVARAWQVVGHRRPDEISGDHASTELAMLDALSEKPDCEYMVLLQPTSPIRLRGRISECIQRMFEGRYDSLVTVTKFYNFCWYEGDNGQDWIATYDYQNRPMRQDLPNRDLLHFDNGNIYITKRTLLEETKCRLGGRVCVHPIKQIEGIQIDTLEDFRTAERALAGNIRLLGVDDVASM